MAKDEDLPQGVQDFPGVGWPIVAERDVRDPMPVQVNGVGLWSYFHTSIFPTQEPPEWGLTLMYAVEDGAILLSMALAGGDELPHVIARVRRMRPLRWWQKRATHAAAVDVVEHRLEMTSGLAEPVRVGAPYDARTLSPSAVGRIPVGRRRGRITREHLEEVARVYRDAWTAGQPPTTAVAAHFDRPHSTAADWVLRARREGVLGAADGTRGGEHS